MLADTIAIFSFLFKSTIKYLIRKFFNIYIWASNWIEYIKNETNWGKNIAHNKINILIPYQYEGHKYIIYNKPGIDSPILSSILAISSQNEDILTEFFIFFKNLGIQAEKKTGMVSFDISKLIRSLAGPSGNFHGNRMTVKDCLFLILSETCHTMEYLDDNLEYCSIQLNIFNQELDKKEFELNDFIFI